MLSMRTSAHLTVICWLVLFNIAEIKAQPGLSMDLKARVYRLFRNSGTESFEASGVIFSEKKYYFLITNKHFVQSDSVTFYDSIFIFLNRILPNGDVMSGPDMRTVYLKKDKVSYLRDSDDCYADLVLIPLSKTNTTLEGDDSLYSITTKTIESPENLRLVQTSHSVVTVVGYPGKKKLLLERTPEFLWGNMIKIEDHRVLYNAPVSKGNSGSMVIMYSKGSYYLLGIHTAHYDKGKVGEAIPASYIQNCFEGYFNKIRANR